MKDSDINHSYFEETTQVKTNHPIDILGWCEGY